MPLSMRQCGLEQTSSKHVLSTVRHLATLLWWLLLQAWLLSLPLPPLRLLLRPRLPRSSPAQLCPVMLIQTMVPFASAPSSSLAALLPFPPKKQQECQQQFTMVLKRKMQHTCFLVHGELSSSLEQRSTLHTSACLLPQKSWSWCALKSVSVLS